MKQKYLICASVFSGKLDKITYLQGAQISTPLGLQANFKIKLESIRSDSFLVSVMQFDLEKDQ